METIKVDVSLAVYKYLEGNRFSFSESHDKILRRLLGLEKEENILRPVYERAPREEKKSRSTGQHGFSIRGRQYFYPNMKAAYLGLLKTISADDDNFLMRLSLEGTSSRRIIAKKKDALYSKAPHLAEKFAMKINQDWWADTNLSRQQVESRVEKICKIAGLHYGSDITIIFP